MITMPVVAFRRLTILPGIMSHFDVDRPKSVATMEQAMVGDQKLFLVAQKHSEIVRPKQKDLFQVGTVEVVKQLVKLPGKVVRVLVGGLEYAELLCLEAEEPAMMGEMTTMGAEEDDLDNLAQEAMLRILRGRLGEYGRVNSKTTKEILSNLLVITDLNEILNQIAIQLPWDYTIRQMALEDSSLSVRYEVVMYTLLTGTEIYRAKKDLQEKVRAGIDQNQEEYILRKQMKVIRQELGENAVSDADEYQKKLDVLKADEKVKEELYEGIERFRNIPARSQEANVLRAHAKTLLDLPWKKMSKDNDDIKHAEKILNEDHYGPEQVKERILECLAVRAPTKKGTSPIICLVGSPGTGKTSITRSVVRALNKKYMHIGLGGVRDEAEIRGYRRTYVGAMSDRIVEGMRQASMSNSLILLDEIDKVGSDYKGNASSTLLEVLDGGQNVKLRDHYVELPIDLSQALFIAMANITQTVLGPLLGRMGLIEVSSYMENEKFHIARDYLVSRQMEHNGLKGSQVTSSNKSLKRIIHNYTREVGVENLERRIGDACRKTARQFLKDKKKSVKISGSNLERYLDREKVISENANEEDETGIVRGLTWTSVGGDTLQIGVNAMPDKGSLLMTGQLGDVMKGPIRATLTYVRFVCPEYGIVDDYLEKHGLHVYIPEDAVPRDRPPVGITMATAMPSMVTGKNVQAKVAMTGEITLRGRVLPIRGLKEETLAAKIVHIEKVPVPDKNRPGMAELSEEITKGLDIVYTKAMEDVVPEVFIQSTGRNQEKQI